MHFKLPLKSIAQKVLLALAATIVLVMSLSGVFYYHAEKDKAVRQLHQKAAQTSERLSNSLVYPLWNVSTVEIAKTIDLETADEDIRAIILYDEFNHFLIGRIEDEQGRITPYSPPQKGSIEIRDVLLVVDKKISKGSEYLGEVRIYFTNRNVNRYLHHLVWQIFLLTALVSIFSILIIYYTLHRIVLTPIMTLEEMTNRLRSAVLGGTPEDRQALGSDGDEIELLGHNFATMSAELTTSQEKLRHTAEHLQTLMDETPDAVVTLDGNGVIMNVNKTFLQMFGGTGKDFIGTAFVDLAANADLRQRIPGYLGLARTGQPVEFEWLAMRKTTDILPVLVRIGAIHAAGDKSLLLAVMTDITQRKRAEEAHRESEAKYRRLVDNLGCEYFFYIHNTEGIMTYVSPSVQDMVGYTQDEFLTHYSAYLTDNPINREVFEKTNLVLQGLKQQPYLVEIFDKSGCPFWLEVSEYPVFDQQGKVVAVEGIAHDITVRKLAQEALRESEKRFRSLFEKSADAILLVENGEFTDCNQAAVDMLRATSKEQIMHRKPVDISPIYQPDGQLSTDKAEQLSVKVTAEGSHRFEWTHRRFSGEEFPTEVLVTLIPSGNRKLIHVVWRDITDRKAAEEALRASESRLHAISDNLTGGMIYQVVFSPDGTRRFNYLSGSVEQMHELTADEVIKDPSVLYSQIVEDDLPGLIEEEERCIKEMRTFNMEARSRLPSGLVRWMKIISQPRRLPTGEILFDGVEIDINELKLTEQALRESEERFSKAFQFNPAPMAITEIESGLFLDANDRWLNLFGYTWEELIGHTSLELNMHVDPALRDAMVTQLMQEGSFKEVDVVIQTKAGQYVNALWSAEIISLGGRDVMLTLLIDVTERKQTELRILESMGLLQATLESAADGILVTDLNAHIVNYNRRFVELSQIPDTILASGDDRTVLKRVLAQLKEPETFLAGVRYLYAHPDIEQHDVLRFLDRRFFERYSIPTYRGDEIIGRVWSFRDVTDTKQAEEALRESEERFSKAFQANPAPMVITDLDTGRFLDANDRWLNLIGYSRAEMIGFTSWDLNIYADPGTRDRMVEILRKDGFFRETDLRLRTKSGQIVDVLWSAEIINLSGQKVMLSLLIDVTERKKAEEALQESRNALSTLLDNTYDAIFLHDLEGRVTGANQRMLDLYQVTREQIPHLTIYDYSSPDNPLENLPVIWGNVLAGEKNRFEWTARRPNDGSIFPVEVFLTKIQLGHDEKILANVRDITERKQSEWQLLESLGLFQATLESTANGILVTDLSGKVIHYNRLFVEMWRITEEILAFGEGQPILQFVVDQLTDPDAFISGVQHLFNHPQEEHRDLIHFKDGRIFDRYSIPTYRGDEIVGRVWSFSDITLEKQAENALRESEAQYRRLHESMTDAFARTDMQGRLLETNKAFQDMLGYTYEELLRLSYKDLTPSVWHKAEADIVENQVVPRGYSDIYEKEYIRKNGDRFPVDVRTYLIQDDNKQSIGLWAIVRDISERKQAEEALRESEALFRSQFEYGNIGIAITSSEKGWLRVNQYICDLLGYSGEELKGKTWAEMTHPEDLPADEAQFNRLLADEIDAYEMDKRYVRKDGEIIVAHLSVSCFRNADRSLRFVISSLLDITETTKAVKKLRTSETTIRALMNATADALFVTDSAGILLALNETSARRFGRSVDNMLGTNIKDYLTAKLARQRMAYFEEAIASGQPVHFVDERQGMWFENTFYPIFNAAGTVNMIATYSRDVTLRKQAEEKLQEVLDFNSKIVSSAAVGIVVFAGTGPCVSTNEAAADILGVPAADLLAQNYNTIESWRKSGLLSMARRVMKHRGSDSAEITMTTSRGKFISFYCHLKWFISTGKPHLLVLIVDNTERKRAENELQQVNRELQQEIATRMKTESALRESEQRYRTLFDNAPIGISIMKPDLTFDYFNPRFTKMLGYTLADLPDKNTWFVKAYPDDDYRQQVIEIWQKDLKSEAGKERKGDRIFKVRAKNGHDFIIHFRTAVLENGEHLMSYEDVTELQKLNDALRDSEARYRTLFEGAPVAIGLATVKGHMIAANEGLVQLFRAPSMEEVLRMNVNSVYTDRAERPGLLKKILQDGAVRNHETVLRCMDGTTVDVIMTMSLFKYAGQDTILSVLQDITWKKQAEEETRHLKNYLTNIIDSMPSMLVGVDIDGQVTQWNTAAEETTGINATLARGQHLEQVLPLLSHHIDLIRQAMRANRAQTFPRLQNAIKGENRFLDVTVYPLVSNGVSGAVVRVDDVTERIRMEEMMIQSEKMLSVGGLAAGMAHEINNPLGVIMAASQNVVRRIAPDLPANVKTAEACGLSLSAVRTYMEKRQILTFLDDIRDGVVRANQIVTNMLSFSRRPSEWGAREYMAELLDQTLLLAASDYDLKKKYDFRQIHIERDYDPETPPVFCQASKIQQVFLNILRNGAEAMEENRGSGHPPAFKLRVFPDQDHVRIEIRDNGPGMDESIRRRIFEPFFTTKPPGVGTGLGLSVSYFIITENHGGAISVESGPGEGTCFIIELPVKEYSL